MISRIGDGGGAEASGDSSARRWELADNLIRIREQIDGACRAVGRAPSEVTLIAVTKTFPASDVALLAELGVTDVGENRDDDARAKAARLRDLAGATATLRWHFVGQLQSNKCRSVAGYADVVHSVDRPRLVQALARAAGELRSDPLSVLIQVNLDHTQHDQASRSGHTSHADHDAVPGATRRRGGVSPDKAAELAACIARHPALKLRGVMGIAPESGDPVAAFSQLERVAGQVRALDASADWISAGMSGDLVSAIAAGATHVRVGSALLGIR